MSLINDALKKAQTDVDRGRMNPASGTLGGMHPQTKRKGSFLVILAIILVVGGAGWAVAFFIAIPSKSADAPVVAQAAAPTELSQAPTVEVVAPTPAAPIEEAPEALVAVAEPVIEPAVPEATVLVEPAPSTMTEPTSEPSVAAEVVVPKTEPVAEAAPSAPPELEALALNDEIIFKLKHLVITAVMGDGKNARIMTGGQVYKTNELINLELRLRFMGKKGPTLYFTDQHNVQYEKAL